MAELTAEIIRELLDYDAGTGCFRWRERNAKWFNASTRRTAESEGVRWNKSFAGTPAGCVAAGGYVTIGVFGRRYYAHRIEWLSSDLDHLNGDKTDNRFANLRVVSDSVNCRNRSLRSDNKSGFNGVYWNKQARKWQAQIRGEKKRIHLGYFATPEDAHAAYTNAAEINGYTDRHIKAARDQ